MCSSDLGSVTTPFGMRVIIALMLGLILSQPAIAQPNSTLFKVAARIASYFQLKVDFQSPVLVITDLDVARGYVDVDAATLFTVTTNASDPFAVDFLPVSPIFSSAVVSGLGASVRIGPDGGVAVYQAPHGRVVGHQLSYRFI